MKTTQIAKSNRMITALSTFLVSAGSIAVAGPDCPTRYTVEVITNLNGNGSQQPVPKALNADTVVGYYHPGIGAAERAFSWTAQGGFVPLPFPAGTFGSTAAAINQNGEIAGSYGNSSGDSGYIRAGNDLITMPPFDPYKPVHVLGMNSTRQVVGYRSSNSLLAFLWEYDTVVDVSADLLPPYSKANDINDSGTITGSMGPSLSRSAFVWHRGVTTDLGQLGSSFNTVGNSINSKGHVCGTATLSVGDPPDFQNRGFFWDGRQMLDIGTLPEFDNVLPFALSDTGAVVGMMRGANEAAFIWKDGVLRNLNGLIPINSPIRLNYAYATNSQNQIAGYGTLVAAPFWPVGYRLTPEPHHAGDVNCDGRVNVDDLLGVVNAWGPCGRSTCAPDLNNDRFVNVTDLLIVINGWG